MTNFISSNLVREIGLKLKIFIWQAGSTIMFIITLKFIYVPCTMVSPNMLFNNSTIIR